MASKAEGGVTNEVWGQLNKVYSELDKLINLLGLEYDSDSNGYTWNLDQADEEWCDEEMLDSIDALHGDLKFFLRK